MKPTVSIIIPCYNQGAFLSYALKSLQAQTIADWECIIVNDGSTDNSAEVAHSFAEHDNRIRIVDQPNSGSAVARNRGLKEVQGEYIQFLDADDLLDKDKLRRQTEYMASQKLDVSYTRNAYFRSQEELGDYTIQPGWQQTYLCSIRTALLSRWGVDFSIPIHCFLFKSRLLRENHLYYNEHIRCREDWQFHLKVSRVYPHLKTMLDYIGAFTRINPSSKTSTYTKMAKGNIQFIHYIRPQIRMWEYPLLTYRLSSEVCQIMIHALHYRTCVELRFIGMLLHSFGDIILLFFAMLLLPVTLIINFIHRI